MTDGVKELAQCVHDQLEMLGSDVRSIPMIGGYIFYYRERIFGGIYGDGFMVKITSASSRYMPESEPKPPYEGARPMFPVTILENSEKLFTKENLKKIFQNDKVAVIHGDLTLENIIILPQEEYYFIDPNVNINYNSIFLDYSKILQSLHGKYELIRTNGSTVSIKDNVITYIYQENKNYDELSLVSKIK